ncbi:hypothetical protein BDY24DRAFT_412312 [Mrakia frigida]|uniref:uncharacterized protein n=1 Tax=Mrakia frigida TaxID=29902 RepID=UPI003FCC105B
MLITTAASCLLVAASLPPSSSGASPSLDWPSTVLALSKLSSVWLGCSFTPNPTLFDVLTCTTCIDRFATSKPQRHRDAQLLGGSEAIWNITYELNFARLLLRSTDFLKTQTCTGTSSDGKVVRDDGVTDWKIPATKTRLDGRRETDLGRHTEVEIEACMCSTCVGLDVDPIDKLMASPVEEVRAALSKGGFDLETFDASTPSVDAGPDSLEVFLRSGVLPSTNLATST